MRVPVKPELIRWARERAGRDLASLQERFPHLGDWERGEAQPTFKQLEDFADAVHAAIGFFFLPGPPAPERVPIPDFRTIGNARLTQPSPDLLDTLFLCQQRQEWYRDHARATGEPPREFIGTVRIADPVVTVAARMRHALGFDVEERRRIPTWADALRRFIEQAESLGVLVMVSGVVGSNTRRKLDPIEFRGFALSDTLAPLVFLNGSDTKAAQMFTMAHELVHLWLGQSGVSDMEASGTPEQELERWCNQVAAELLVPLETLRAEYDGRAALRTEMDRLARHFKVSTLVVLRRIHDAGGISRERLRQAYQEELERLRAVSAGSGGNFYLTLGARASKRFARAVVVSTMEGRASFSEAFRLLGFKKMSSFDELARSLGVSV